MFIITIYKNGFDPNCEVEKTIIYENDEVEALKVVNGENINNGLMFTIQRAYE